MRIKLLEDDWEKGDIYMKRSLILRSMSEDHTVSKNIFLFSVEYQTLFFFVPEKVTILRQTSKITSFFSS